MSKQVGTTAVILAAGLGTRMKSSMGKVRHTVLGMPLVVHVVRAALESGAERVVVVVGQQAEEVEKEVRQWLPEAPLEFALQANPQGTGHAVLMAETQTEGCSRVLILNGDVPGIQASTLRDLEDSYNSHGGKLALATSTVAQPTGYGRMVRSVEGALTHIAEQKDATSTEKEIHEINVGLYLCERSFLFEALHAAGTDNAQGEIYLTHVVPHAVSQGLAIGTVSVDEGPEMWGINNRVELARVEAALRRQVNERHMLAGVTLTDPDTVTIAPQVTIGPDTLIRGGCRLEGSTSIGGGCMIDEGAVIKNATLDENVHVKPYCVIEDAKVGSGTAVGPFAHLRPGTHLETNVKVGNFVETKKAHLKAGAKASHLSYLGDCEIGEESNIGAGTITCNYDGVNKFRTVLGKGVFIGSDTQLVAPVELGDGAFVGAGTTVTSNVPAGALAISRSDQKNIEGWVARKNARREKKKS